MDGMYWSVERCGWAPCRGGHEVVATPWHVEDAAANAAAPPAPVPQQRAEEPARAEA